MTGHSGPSWFDDDSVAPRRREAYGILAEVWGAALDATSSRDFRGSDGALDEAAYLR